LPGPGETLSFTNAGSVITVIKQKNTHINPRMPQTNGKFQRPAEVKMIPPMNAVAAIALANTEMMDDMRPARNWAARRMPG
jgi:hypothetical protein